MKVSKKSWHYRVLNKLDLLAHFGNETLCKYFWKVVLAVIGLPFIVLVGCVFLTSPVWYWIFVTTYELFPLVVLAAAFDIVILVGLCRDYLRGQGKLPAKKIKPQSITSQWLHAKHRKVCPFIDFE